MGASNHTKSLRSLSATSIFPRRSASKQSPSPLLRLLPPSFLPSHFLFFESVCRALRKSRRQICIRRSSRSGKALAENPCPINGLPKCFCSFSCLLSASSTPPHAATSSIAERLASSPSHRFAKTAPKKGTTRGRHSKLQQQRREKNSARQPPAHSWSVCMSIAARLYCKIIEEKKK